jgi:hypothetical protein
MPEIARGTTRGKALRRSDATDRAFRTLVRHLHRLGPRPVGELLGEIVTAIPEAAPVLAERLSAYADLNPRLVEWLGGRDWLDQRDVIRAVGGV